uniref:Uncharacterized protein n=1 Tax=Kalanchoe fedtschenkoi TaxID=63787 RepID=A0A7N1A9F2_KALFE
MVILESEKDVIAALTQAPRRVGTFLDSDTHTKKRTRCAYARCCVEIDLAKVLPTEIWIDTGDGNGWWQEIVYEGNLKYCSKCSLHGHMLSECRRMRMRPHDRQGDTAEQEIQKQGTNGAQTFPKNAEANRKAGNQEWILVLNKKANLAKGNKTLQHEVQVPREEKGEDKSHPSPITEEEEEIVQVQNNESHKITSGLSQNWPPMIKSKSSSHLSEQIRRKEDKGKEYLQTFAEDEGGDPEKIKNDGKQKKPESELHGRYSAAL